MKFEVFFHCNVKIGQWSAPAKTLETRSDFRVKPQTAYTEKIMIVNLPGINKLLALLQQQVNRLFLLQRDTQRTGKTVARTAGNQPQDRIRVHHSPGHLIHCSVAAHGNDLRHALLHRLFSELGGLSGITCVLNLEITVCGMVFIGDKLR